MDIDMVAEKGSGPLRAAHENGRAGSRINEALSYPGADVSRGADDEVFHCELCSSHGSLRVPFASGPPE